VLRDGKVTYEWYGDGFTADTRMPSWSVAKSVVSLLVGQAIERGKLHESDRLVDLLPELRSKDTYDSITVRDLPDMSSGIDVDENHSPWRPFTGTARMMLTRDLRTFVKYHRDLTYAPGSRASYRSVDTMMLGLILMRVEKKTPADLVGQSFWKPMGATHTATWNLDRPQEMGHRLAAPAAHRIDTWGHSAQWWHPSGGNGKDFSAIGIYGQDVYVAPDARPVIVKMSNYGTQQDEQETFDALRSITQHHDEEADLLWLVRALSGACEVNWTGLASFRPPVFRIHAVCARSAPPGSPSRPATAQGARRELSPDHGSPGQQTSNARDKPVSPHRGAARFDSAQGEPQGDGQADDWGRGLPWTPFKSSDVIARSFVHLQVLRDRRQQSLLRCHLADRKRIGKGLLRGLLEHDGRVALAQVAALRGQALERRELVGLGCPGGSAVGEQCEFVEPVMRLPSGAAQVLLAAGGVVTCCAVWWHARMPTCSA